MAAKGEVDLIIRAKNEATKNLDAINKSLKSLADQQAIVGDSAGKADDKLAQLGLELQKLRTNAQNLQALSNVGEILNKATDAMLRQRAAAAQAGDNLADLTARQKQLADQQANLAGHLKTATAELNKQASALGSAKTSLGALSKETTQLANREKSLNTSLGTTAEQLSTRQTALEQAVAKQAQLTAAIAAAESVTKRQQESLDAANRSLERRRTAVEQTVAKEASLRDELTRVQSALERNAKAIVEANQALAGQGARVNEAKNAVAGLKVQADSVATAERNIAKEVRSATAAVEQQASALDRAQNEYGEVQAAATSARQAITGSSQATTNAGSSAAKAAVQVATFAARLAVLAGAGAGKTTNPVIVDPAQVRAAEGALKELGVTIRAADNDASSASVSAKELTTALKGVGSARNDIQGISTAISTQQSAVTGARAAWQQAEAEVKRLALAIKAADQPSEELATALGRAQGAARLAKTEFQQQSAAAAKMAADLQSAGVGIGTLESAQASLAPKLQRANDLMSQGQAASARMGAAARQLGTDAGSAEPRVNRLAVAVTALSSGASRLGSATNPLRAFKNELVAMVAAGAGLYAIKEQLQSIWQVGSDLASNQAKFGTAFGGMEEGNKELEYARQVALNLKLPVNDLVKSYGDLALAAKDTSLEGEGARKVFEAFAQTARVNQMSGEALDGTFKALTQIMSKGKVQAEELRQQLGDRLPGALQLMAKGIGVSVEELDKMMERGELTRETLLNMAAEASGRVAPMLVEALSSPAAKLQDFQNRMTVFKEEIANSGFLEAVADGFERMAQALSTPEALDGARKLGEGLADLITWLVSATDHIDTIITVLQGLGIAWATVQITSMVAGFISFAGAIGTAATAITGLGVAMSPILVGLGLLGAAVAAVVAAFAVWKLAEWAYENFPAFAEGVMNVRNVALEAWDAILQFWEMTGVRLKNSFARITAQIADMWYGMMNKILSAFPELTSALGLGDYAGEIAKRAADAAAAVTGADAKMNAELDEIRERYAGKEQQRQKDLQDDIAGYYEDRKKREAAAGQVDGTAGGGTPPRKPAAGGAGLGLVTADTYVPDDTAAREKAEKEAARRRLTLEKSVADQMYGIRAQLEKKSADTLDEQLAAVPAKYAKLYDQLRQLGKDRTSEEWRTLDALVAQEQTLIRETHQKKESTRLAKEARQAETEENNRRKEAMEQVNTLMTTRKNIIEAIKQAEDRGDVDAVATLKENLATVTTQADEAINGMITFWQSVGGPDADAAIAKLQTMKLELTKVQQTGILTGEAIAKAFGSQLASAGDRFVDTLAETGDIIGALKESFRQMAIDFLKQIAKMILQQAIFNALKAASGAFGGFFGTAANAVAGAATNHTGGVVGRDSGPRRMLPAAMFQNAVRYHGGGVAGLKPNEVPTVLEAGEVVRTQQQEKALADRMDAARSGGADQPIALKIVNQFDAGDVVSDGLNTAAGERAFFNMVSQNKGRIKGMLG